MRRRCQIQFGSIAAKQGCEFIAENLDNLLPGFHGFEHLLSHGLFLDMGNKLASNAILHVGIQKRHTHITQRVLDVGFGNFAQATHFAQRIIKLIGKKREHGITLAENG